jgi:SAM-dependent methyltransferase
MSTPSESFQYIGNELELFQHARNWKAYLEAELRPYIVGNVLEVGAGIGATARALCDGRQQSWTALEPDPSLARHMETEALARRFPCAFQIVVGTLAHLPPGRTYDSVIYVDVLEHIEDDRAELAAAARQVAPGGTLVVLSPAHPWLYSEFDRRIGHFRRYNAASITAISPPGFAIELLRYLDAAGMLASVCNRLLLHQDSPTIKQIRVWDSWLVPISRRVDQLLGHRIGKSIVAVWRAPVRPAVGT